MPVDYTIDPEQRLVHIRIWDVVTGAEIVALRQRLANDRRLPPPFLELIDARTAISVQAITTNDIRSLASQDIEPVARRAFVTTDPAAFGLARMFQTYRSIKEAPEQNQVFRHLEKAKAWLNE